MSLNVQSLRDSLVPLPTWEPLNWELAMKYRQTLAAEGLNKQEQEAELQRKPPAGVAAPPPSPQKRVSGSSPA